MSWSSSTPCSFHSQNSTLPSTIEIDRQKNKQTKKIHNKEDQIYLLLTVLSLVAWLPLLPYFLAPSHASPPLVEAPDLPEV